MIKNRTRRNIGITGKRFVRIGKNGAGRDRIV